MSSASLAAGTTKRLMSAAAELARAARSSSSASSSGMLAGGNSAAWSIRRSSTAAGELAALDAAAGHDVVAAVRPAHPCLVAAVVVRRPQDQRGLLALDPAGLGALLVESAPQAHERVRLPLVTDRRRIGVAGMHARLVRQLHQHIHDRVLQVGEARRPRRAHAADRALEER